MKSVAEHVSDVKSQLAEIQTEVKRLSRQHRAAKSACKDWAQKVAHIDDLEASGWKFHHALHALNDTDRAMAESLRETARGQLAAYQDVVDHLAVAIAASQKIIEEMKMSHEQLGVQRLTQALADSTHNAQPSAARTPQNLTEIRTQGYVSRGFLELGMGQPS